MKHPILAIGTYMAIPILATAGLGVILLPLFSILGYAALLPAVPLAILTGVGAGKASMDALEWIERH